MKVDIYLYKQHYGGKLKHDTTPTYLGYAEVAHFFAEEIWDLCNWACWTKEKPANLHADITNCGHGLCLVNPITKHRHLSLSFGWLVGDEQTINDYVLKNVNNPLWTKE